MPFNRIHQRTVSEGTLNLAGTPITVEFNLKNDIDIVISTNAANQQLDCVLDVSEIKSLYLKASTNTTLKFNSSSSPVTTINLIGGRALEWCSSDGTANPLGSTDITTLYVSPGATNTAFQFYVGSNATN